MLQHRPFTRFWPTLPILLMWMLLIVLCLAGGASRADALGQTVVRAMAALVLLAVVLLADRPKRVSPTAVWVLLAAAILLAVVQLLPLPPAVWEASSGRAFSQDATALAGSPPISRPLSLSPGATVNAAASMIVPLAVLCLATASSVENLARLPGFILCLVTATMLVGLLQFSGVGIDNPLVNDRPGVVSGTIANRNHFALFLALGCLLVPVWMFRDGRRAGWRGPVGLGLLLLFTLTILASGSRAGIVLGMLAILLAGLMAHTGLRRELRHAPRWVLPAVFAAVVALIAAFVLISVAANRAVSIQRSLSVDVEQDMRSRALPTVWEMIRAAFPTGNGLGSFDPMFRVREPLALLKPTYFNQAHNDFLGVVLDAGMLGLLLLVGALGWWAWASVGAWRNADNRRSMLPRLGSAMLLLVVIASMFDYPARTPLIMAMVTLAAIWLSSQSNEEGASPLPQSNQHL